MSAPSFLALTPAQQSIIIPQTNPFSDMSITMPQSRVLQARAKNPLYTVRCRYNAVNFLPNPHEIHPIARPLGRGMVCNLWFDTLIYILLQSTQCRIRFCVIFDRVITALDCTRCMVTETHSQLQVSENLSHGEQFILNSFTPGRCGSHFKSVIFFLGKWLSGEYHRTPWMKSPHWRTY